MGKDNKSEEESKKEGEPCGSCATTGTYYSEVLNVDIPCPWCNGTGTRS